MLKMPFPRRHSQEFGPHGVGWMPKSADSAHLLALLMQVDLGSKSKSRCRLVSSPLASSVTSTTTRYFPIVCDNSISDSTSLDPVPLRFSFSDWCACPAWRSYRHLCCHHTLSTCSFKYLLHVHYVPSAVLRHTDEHYLDNSFCHELSVSRVKLTGTANTHPLALENLECF